MGSIIIIGGSVFTPTDPYWANVISLLHHDGVDGALVTTDVIGSKTWTMVSGGDTKLDAASALYGPTGLLVGNTSGVSTTNGIHTPHHTDFDFGTGDWTVEWMERPHTNNSFQTAYVFDPSGTSGLIIQTGNGDGKYNIYIGGSLVCTEASARATGSYQHCAACKDSGTVRFYRGGVQTASGSSAVHIIKTGAGFAAWGAYGPNLVYPAGAYAVDGEMEENRITLGVCRYPGGTTFTPPSSAFTYP